MTFKKFMFKENKMVVFGIGFLLILAVLAGVDLLKENKYLLFSIVTIFYVGIATATFFERYIKYKKLHK